MPPRRAHGNGACRNFPAAKSGRRGKSKDAPPQGLPASFRGGVFPVLPAGFAEQARHERGESQGLWANMGPCPIPHIKIRKTGAEYMVRFRRLQENTRQGHDSYRPCLTDPALPASFAGQSAVFLEIACGPGDAPFIRKPRRTQNTCRPARDAPSLSAYGRAPCLPARCPRARR